MLNLLQDSNLCNIAGNMFTKWKLYIVTFKSYHYTFTNIILVLSCKNARVFIKTNVNSIITFLVFIINVTLTFCWHIISTSSSAHLCQSMFNCISVYHTTAIQIPKYSVILCLWDTFCVVEEPTKTCIFYMEMYGLKWRDGARTNTKF